ncbi:MAG: pitrilysin family protein [Candidatus Limisoma sp.]|nr:pitrilysin family protein [Candidatus Limisoma sp.]
MKSIEVKNVVATDLVEPERIRLDNGTQLLVINAADQDVSKLEIVTEGGMCAQTKASLATLVATMANEGTARYSADDIALAGDYYGAWFVSEALTHASSLSVFSLNRNFDKILDYFESMWSCPTFPDDRLENLKKRACARLKVNVEKVNYLALVALQSEYYGSNHPLGFNVDEQAISDISTGDLQAFHDRWTKPQNSTILLSGKVSDKMIDSVNAVFGKAPHTGERCLSADDAPRKDFEPKTVVIDKPEAVQSAIKIGIPTILRTHPDYIPLRILIRAFGGYFGSRLMQNIREDKGYTYGISSYLSGMRNNSLINISCQCDNRYTYRVVDEIRAEIKRMQTEPIPEEELNRVKLHVTGELLKTTDTPFSIAEYYSLMISNAMPHDYFRNQIDCVASITPEKIQEMAIKYLSADLALTVIAGNRAKF